MKTGDKYRLKDNIFICLSTDEEEHCTKFAHEASGLTTYGSITNIQKYFEKIEKETKMPLSLEVGKNYMDESGHITQIEKAIDNGLFKGSNGRIYTKNGRTSALKDMPSVWCHLIKEVTQMPDKKPESDFISPPDLVQNELYDLFFEDDDEELLCNPHLFLSKNPYLGSPIFIDTAGDIFNPNRGIKIKKHKRLHTHTVDIWVKKDNPHTYEYTLDKFFNMDVQEISFSKPDDMEDIKHFKVTAEEQKD